MIARVTYGHGFAGANRYFSEEGKCQGYEARNLPTQNHQINAEVMQATAMQSKRVEKPVMNISVSWDEGDKVNDRQVFQHGHELMERLGFKDYQYMIYKHQDRDHPHIHVMVNRVNPETEKALYIRGMYKDIDNFNRQKELENGWRFVPGRYTDQKYLDRAGVEIAEAPNLKVRVRKTRADRVLFNASSWGDMHTELKKRGFGIDKLPNKGGQIFRIDNPKDRLKLTAISQKLSMSKIEKRLGEFNRIKQHKDQPQSKQIQQAGGVTSHEEIQIIKGVKNHNYQEVMGLYSELRSSKIKEDGNASMIKGIQENILNIKEAGGDLRERRDRRAPCAGTDHCIGRGQAGSRHPGVRSARFAGRVPLA